MKIILSDRSISYDYAVYVVYIVRTMLCHDTHVTRKAGL